MSDRPLNVPPVRLAGSFTVRSACRCAAWVKRGTMTQLCTQSEKVGLGDIFRDFLVIGATSFGGGVVAYQKILLTEKRRWFSIDEFKAMLAISQTMPGLNAVNIAVLAGDRLRGAAGAFMAALALLLPGCLFVAIAGMLYLSHPDSKAATCFLIGVAAAATGLLASITYRLAEGRLFNLKYLSIMLFTFALMSLAGLSLPMVLAIVAPVAIFLNRPKPGNPADAA